MIYDMILVVATKAISNALQKLVKDTVKVVVFGEALCGIGCLDYMILSQSDSRDSEAEMERRHNWIESSLKTRIVKK